MELVFLIVFALFTVGLILLKLFKIGSRRRGILKMITSIMFVIAGVYGCVINVFPYCWVLFAGLCFAFIGDFMLVFADVSVMFKIGVISFSCASLTFVVYSVLVFDFRWWALLIFAVFAAANVLLQVYKIYRFGSMTVYLNIYTVLVGLCGSLGLSILFTATAARMILFGLGCFMYQLSDIVLGLYMYKFKRPVVDAVNTALYFPAMLLIALSVVL